MTWKSDDLAQIVVGEDREFVGYAQGILRGWDPDSHRNVVEVRGGVLTDLPVADPIGALTYTPGMVLKLIRWKQRTAGGIASYWIDGSVTFPADGRAEQSIAFMRGQLARRIAGEVFAARVHAAEVAALEVTTDDAFTDLDTVGPQIPDVEITAGVAVVMLSAGGAVTAPAGAGSETQYMGVAVSGASSVAANIKDSYALQVVNHNSDGTNHTIGARAGIPAVIPGLNPGLHTFTAKYRVGASGGSASFHDRTMVVIGL